MSINGYLFSILQIFIVLFAESQEYSKEDIVPDSRSFLPHITSRENINLI